MLQVWMTIIIRNMHDDSCVSLESLLWSLVRNSPNQTFMVFYGCAKSMSMHPVLLTIFSLRF